MTVPLRIGEVLMAPGVPIRHILFVEDGILSMIATASDGRQIELALIGREGLVGLRAILGTSPDLHAFLLRYAYSLTVQIAGTALANTRYKVEQRLARWLLMCHDRTRGDELPTTHRFLSLMLGINRPGLTAALSVFEQAGMIRTERGAITIRDRPALLAKAGACYGGPEGEYERLLVEGRLISL
jgi:CRP-like cAMP-binding protein